MGTPENQSGLELSCPPGKPATHWRTRMLNCHSVVVGGVGGHKLWNLPSPRTLCLGLLQCGTRLVGT